MSAIISGHGLGLFHAGIGALTANGGSDRARFGQGAEAVFVNAATGNLVIQKQDESRKGLGLGFGALRTYNSQGESSRVTPDHWRMGYVRTLELEGQANRAGSALIRVAADGSEQRFEYDAGKGRYISHQGGGPMMSLS